jgi:hypothetical protein
MLVQRTLHDDGDRDGGGGRDASVVANTQRRSAFGGNCDADVYVTANAATCRLMRRMPVQPSRCSPPCRCTPGDVVDVVVVAGGGGGGGGDWVCAWCAAAVGESASSTRPV